MSSREELFKLVETLPEGAIGSASRVLTRFQVWPPEGGPGFLLRKVATLWRGGAAKGDEAYTDGDFTVLEHRLPHEGHEFAIVEKCRTEGDQLNYVLEVTGPDGTLETRECRFPLPKETTPTQQE